MASGTDTRKPRKAATLAHHLMARVFADGIASSTRRPARGVNRTIDRMWSIVGFGLAPHDITVERGLKCSYEAHSAGAGNGRAGAGSGVRGGLYFAALPDSRQ